MYERILVALDGSALAETVLPHAEALAGKFGSTIVLLQVTPILQSATVAASPPDDPTLVHRIEHQTVAAYLAEVENRLRGHGCTVEVRQKEGDAAEQILSQAAESSVGMIAMATHGRSGLQRVLLGSVADEVVKKAACPVLLVRASRPQ
jgi:nucleotide-binding universal stress UspA family protein